MLLAACSPLRSPLWTASAAGDRYGSAFLTRDGGDHIQVQGVSTGVHTQALPTNEESNTRAVFWPKGVHASTDGESCATWSGRQGDAAQQGAALRVTRADGRVRAVTVTQTSSSAWGGSGTR